MTFRNPAARDAAWGRYFAKRGLQPTTRDTRTRPNPVRLAEYHRKRELARVVRY